MSNRGAIHPSLKQEFLVFHNFNVITQELDIAVENSLFTIIIADAGYGKTCSIKDFRTRRKHAFLITLDPKITNKKQFFIDLLTQVSSRDIDHEIITMKRTAELFSWELSNIKSKKIIIIDDAGRFDSDMMQIYQYVRDKNEDTGLVLVGTTDFLKNLMNWKMRNVPGIPELTSRVNRWIVMENQSVHSINEGLVFKKLIRPSSEEFVALCNHNGIFDEKVVINLIVNCQSFRELESRIINYHIEEKIKRKPKK